MHRDAASVAGSLALFAVGGELGGTCLASNGMAESENFVVPPDRSQMTAQTHFNGRPNSNWLVWAQVLTWFSWNSLSFVLLFH